MNKDLTVLTKNFDSNYEKQAEEISILILRSNNKNRNKIVKKITEVLIPIIDDMFKEGMIVSNQIVKKGVARLVADNKIPFKYNKDLLLKMNDKSIFQGYYDKTYKSLYSKREIDRLKRTILTAKYSGWDEKKTIKEIKSVVKTTTSRARLLARHEKARLTTVAKTIYFESKKIQKEYDMVWHNSGGNVRPDHEAMAGKKADKDGMFYSSKYGLISGPPLGYNCKCYVTLEKRSDE